MVAMQSWTSPPYRRSLKTKINNYTGSNRTYNYYGHGSSSNESTIEWYHYTKNLNPPSNVFQPSSLVFNSVF